MAETFEEYRNRILGYLEPTRVQKATPVRLHRLIRGVPSRVLARRPAPEKWSIVEVVAHLADAELAMGWRLRKMLATPGVGIPWWDEHPWSQKWGRG